MSYRSALVGIAAGLGFLFFFCLAAGASPYLPIAFFALYFIVATAITRIRAEFGPPAQELNFFRPEEILISVLGTQALGAKNLTLMTYFYWFNRGYRNLVMPHQLEALKIAQVSKESGRKFARVALLASLLGILATFWALLHIYYVNGAASTKTLGTYRTWIGNYAFIRLDGWVSNPKEADLPALGFMGAGAVFVIFLSLMRSLFQGWPFHPIGYGLAVSYAMDYFWFTAVIGWTLKWLTVRYGGLRLYQRLLPFFAGLILGDYVIASAWTLIGWALQVTTYKAFI